MANRKSRDQLKKSNLKRTRLRRAKLSRERAKGANAKAMELKDAKMNAKEAAKLCRSFTAIPCQPTEAIPGTRRKLNVMASRIEAGEELWNQNDGLESS